MNKSANSNIYEVTARDTLELYGYFVEGDGGQSVLVVSGGPTPLSPRARVALNSSMERLGYGVEACAFALIALPNDAQLGANDIFTLIEGLDPLLVVASDASAGRALAQAYRAKLNLDETTRLLGRPALVFASFEAMLDSESERQRAWALMKAVAR